MRIFSPDGENIVLEADDLQDAIELQALSTFSMAETVGIRVETNRNQFFRAFIPARVAPLDTHLLASAMLVQLRKASGGE